MKFLLVDPSATMRRVLKNALTAVECDEIIEAADGRQALERCDASVDVAITEWSLPVLNGIELVKRWRANPETSKVRVLMLSTRNSRADVLEAVQAGVQHYLLKPFTAENLRLKLEDLVPPAADDQAKAA